MTKIVKPNTRHLLAHPVEIIKLYDLCALLIQRL